MAKTFRQFGPLALVFAATLTIYLLTLTGVHTFDAYSYAAAVQTKPWRQTLHPHHLAYGPLGAFVYGAARALGYTGMALLPLQVLNALAGAAGVTLWSALIRRWTGRWALALLGAVLLGGAYAFWYYAVEVEVYTLATLFLIAGLALLLRLLDHPLWAKVWIWLGVAHALAILFHQTNVLWTLAVLAAWLLARWPAATSWRVRWRMLGCYTLAAGLIVGGSYALVIVGSGFRSWAAIRGWLFEYAETGFWGGPINGSTITRLAEGWRFTLAENGGWLWLGYAAIVGLGARALWTRWRRVTLVMLAWLGPYTLFFGWWEADNIEFWIATLPPLLLLVLLALASVSGWRQAVAGTIGVAIAALLLVQNSRAISQRGDPATDTDRRAVVALATQGAPNDLYLVPNGLQELYLRYEYGRENVLALSLGNGDWAMACTIFRTTITDTTGAGYRVWIDPVFFAPPPELLERYRLQRDAVQRCFAPFADAPTQLIGGTRYILLQPTAGTTPDWLWSTWSLGWKPNFISDSQFSDGWSFVPGDDPHLISPRLQLNTADWSAIEITMATTIADQHGQFYWIAPGGQATEDRSLTWQIIADGQPHTYRLALREHPEWQGTIGLLRLDPVQHGDGNARVNLQRVRLVP